MSLNQINFLEKELIRLSNEIIKSKDNIDLTKQLNNEYNVTQSTLRKLRICEFEEREYLDFDDDLR